MNVLDAMKEHRLFCDGGMGSLLQAAGLAAGELPERWNLSHPEVITDVHRKYLAAGADIMTTNTFGANRLKYDKDGELKAIVEAAVANARKAVDEAGRGYVALDLGPTGKLLKPLGTLDFEDAVSIFARTIKAGAAAGADLILIETMSDTYELKAAVLAAKENTSLPVFATTIFDERGKLLLLQNPFCIFTFRINIGIIIKDCDLEIFRQILQHITAARCTTAMEQKRGDFAFFP